MRLVRLTTFACVSALLSACADPGYRPSSQSVRAVETLRDVEYAGQYLITGFNPCGRPQASKSVGYAAGVKLDRRGNIIPEADIRVRATC